MPLFHFDTIDTGTVMEDHEGVELPDVEAARKEALATLGAIAKDELPDGDYREFVINVRDGEPTPILTAFAFAARRAPGLNAMAHATPPLGLVLKTISKLLQSAYAQSSQVRVTGGSRG